MCASTAYAAATTAWYYSGDTFNVGSTVFSVEGTDHERVLLGVGSTLYVINLGECKEQGLSKYCYVQSAYPGDKDHIKYAAGEQYYGYQISVEELAPKLTIKRIMSKNSPRLGESVDVEVTVENTGEYSVNYFLYNESVPEGILVDGSSARTFLHTQKTLAVGDTDRFTYRLQATDYVSANLQPRITYQYGTAKYNMTVPAISFVVDTPYRIDRHITSSLSMGERGTYSLNLTNKDPDLPLIARLVIRFSDGIRPTDSSSGFIIHNASVGIINVTLQPGKNSTYTLNFTTSLGGALRIPINATITSGDTTFNKYYEDTATVKSDKINPVIRVSTGRTTFKPGEQITASGILQNANAKTTFQEISGSLEGKGLFDPKTFSHDSFGPGRNLTEAEVQFITPPVMNATSFIITLRGKYSTPTGDIIAFETNKSLRVEPIKEYVVLTRTVTPKNATPGGNITVTVNAKNVYNEYLTFSAHETYDPSLVRSSGITFAEVSLERDKSEDLYIYQLTVPENYTANINLTTVILVKDEVVPARYSSVIPVSGAPPVPTEAAVANTTQDGNSNQSSNRTTEDGADTPATADKKNLGFFASIWDFLKGIFS